MTASTEIDELRDALHRDPGRVAHEASRLAAYARAAGDQAMLSRALSVLGRARRAVGEIQLAESDLDAAIAAAVVAGDDELAADAHLGLAGVYAFTGRSAEAIEHLNRVHRLGSARIRAYALLQRAALDQRIGNLADALAGYERALPTLREVDARVDIAVVLMNRGVIHTSLGDCEAAVADLTDAGQLFAAQGNAYAEAQSWHGLGWAYANRGDLTAALRYLDQASDRFRDLGHAAAEVEVDRAEVLLWAGLFGLATEAAQGVAARLSAAGNDWHVALSWLVCARAGLLSGDLDEAAASAERARAIFADSGAAAWERVARLELIRARTAAGQPCDVDEVQALIAGLDQAGHARGTVTALGLASVAAVDAGALDLAATLSAECSRRAARLGIFELRAAARYAVAACAVAHDDTTTAARAVRNGLADLRRHRSTITAPDAQAAIALHARRLAALGMRMAVADGSAERILQWMERIREAQPSRPAPVPPVDSDLAARLRELRSVAVALRTAETDGRDTADLLRRQRDLERLAHRQRLRLSAAASTRGGWRTPDVSALRSSLDGGCLVELSEVDGRLVGVSVGASAIQWADVGSAARAYEIVGAGGAALRSLVTEPVNHPARAGLLQLLGRAADALDRFVAPLLTGEGPVILVIPAALHEAAWSLLPSLAGRPVSVAPSATWWHTAGTSDDDRAAERVVVAAGPRLAMAERECAAVAACYADPTVLTGQTATTAAVLTAWDGASMAHLVSHGRIRDDNALWSALELSDGPLYFYDLDRQERTPTRVVLSGCETGAGVRVGDQLIGLSSVLLRRGTRTLMAARCPVPDSAATADTMAALHRRLAGRATPAAALAELSAGGRRGDPVGLVAAALGCFGIC